jgi:hypothetical protein
MWKKYLSWFIAALLLLIPVAPTASAQPQKEKAVSSIEQTKLKVAKLGLGEKARATITMKDGSKTKGYVYRAGEDDFIIRDRKTDAPTTIRYADVAKVKPDRGHSTAKNLGLGIGIGVGAFLGILLIVFAHLND